MTPGRGGFASFFGGGRGIIPSHSRVRGLLNRRDWKSRIKLLNVQYKKTDFALVWKGRERGVQMVGRRRGRGSWRWP